MGRTFETDRPSFEEIRKLRKPRTHTVGLVIDGDVLARIEDLERDLRVARRLDASENREPEAPAIEAELDEVRAAAETAVIGFTFQELPRKRYRELIEASPTEDRSRRWDEETFAPALIAEACIDPVLTPADALALWDEWSDVHCSVLFGAALMVNEAQPKIPFGVTATGRTADSPPSSTTAPPEESLTADS